MNITLSWDLFIVVFMALVLAYSFIVGRRQTVKIIAATYVAFLAADGLGYFVRETIGFKIPSMLFGFNAESAAILTTILLFILFIVLLARHETFDVAMEDNPGTIVYALSTLFVGALSALLMVAGILFFLSGNHFSVFGTNFRADLIAQIVSQSNIAQRMVDYFHVWFFLPALSLVLYSVFKK